VRPAAWQSEYDCEHLGYITMGSYLSWNIFRRVVMVHGARYLRLGNDYVFPSSRRLWLELREPPELYDRVLRIKAHFWKGFMPKSGEVGNTGIVGGQMGIGRRLHTYGISCHKLEWSVIVIIARKVQNRKQEPSFIMTDVLSSELVVNNTDHLSRACFSSSYRY